MIPLDIVTFMFVLLTTALAANLGCHLWTYRLLLLAKQYERFLTEHHEQYLNQTSQERNNTQTQFMVKLHELETTIFTQKDRIRQYQEAYNDLCEQSDTIRSILDKV